jgi:hypothetical protein
MRADICAIVAVLMVPGEAQQRGVVSAVALSKTSVQAGLPIVITVTGANPCGAVRIDPGDGSERITHPVTQLPATVQYVYQRAGRVEIRAEGMGNCDGVAAAGVEVTPAPAPPPPQPTGPPPARGDRDEVIVAAAKRWTSTDVRVRAGDLVRVESAGTVQLSGDAADTSTPGGAGSGRRAPSAPLPDRPAGGLIARIGNSPPIFIGADRTFRANASGQLFLGVNDDYVADNRGEFRVTIDPPRGRRRR